MLLSATSEYPILLYVAFQEFLSHYKHFVSHSFLILSLLCMALVNGSSRIDWRILFFFLSIISLNRHLLNKNIDEFKAASENPKGRGPRACTWVNVKGEYFVCFDHIYPALGQAKLESLKHHELARGYLFEGGASPVIKTKRRKPVTGFLLESLSIFYICFNVPWMSSGSGLSRQRLDNHQRTLHP